MKWRQKDHQPTCRLKLRTAWKILLLTFCRLDVEKERQTIVSFLDHNVHVSYYAFIRLQWSNIFYAEF